jgi:signal transduction histidine kinase
METPQQQTPKDKKDDTAREKMEKRVKNMFAEQEPPSYASIREVDAMKARISELENELASRQREDEQVSSPSGNEAVVAAELEQPAQSSRPVPSLSKIFTITDEPDVNSGRPKRIALWLVGICTAIDLVFLSYLTYLVVAVYQGQFDLATKILMPVSLVALITNFVAYRFIRGDRLSLGIGVLFFMGVLLPAISAVFVLQGFGYIAVSYIILMTFIIVSLVLPKNSRRWVIIAAVVSILLSIGIEYGDPYFRVDSSVEKLSGFASIIIAVAVVGLIVFVVRQTAISINAKLVTAFALVAVLSMGVVAFQSSRTLRNSLTSDIVNNQAFLANSQGLRIGQAINSQYDKLKSLSTIKSIREGTEAANLDESRPRDVSEIEQINLAWREAIKSKNATDPLAIKVLYNPLSTQLRRFQETFPENAEILLTDEKGFSIAATTLPNNYYQADSLWWRTAHTTGQYIGQPIFDPVTNSVALDIAIPIYSYNTGDFVGVLRTTVDFNALTDLLAEGIHGQTGYSMIYQPNNQQIKLQALEDGTYKIVQEFASGDLENFFKSSDTSQELSLDDVRVLASSAPVRSNSSILPGEAANALDALNWQMVVVQEKNEALQPVNIQTRNNLVLAIFVIIIVVAISYFLAGFITKPIVRLTSVANQLASGNLTAEAQVETKDEIGTLASTFNRMTSQLREILQGLEERIADRTHDLELANEVGKTVASKVDNLSELLDEAVELIRARFNLYYTQVYTTDYTGYTITLRAGTGEVGRELLNRGHHLLINSNSLNGRAVSEKQTILVSNTMDNPNFLPNPLLPKTRSEMAVPLIVGDRVVGVLDMQSEHANALNKENQTAFEAMAGQLAVAIQNSILFNEMNEARMLVEEQSRRLTSSGWQEFLNAVERSETIGYTFDQKDILPLGETNTTATPDSVLIVPIEVAGAHIGEVQLADEEARTWTATETEIVQTVISRVAQHIETLRLLAQAERYRHEAEQVSRRLTSEGWSEYFRTRKETADGFRYNQDKVQALNGNGQYTSSMPVLTHQLTVRDEPIGVMMVDHQNGSESEASELIAAVAEQLSDHIENLRLLEQAEQRRLELETVATVSSTVSTVLDPDRLLQAVVDMTKERFALYHAHIYLADDDWDTLLLAAGAGEIGRRMVAQQHAIPMGMEHSLVARASRERKTIISNDVKNNPNFLANPMLPDTHAEMAIPMIVGSEVLGVFDVQSDKSGGFSKEDADIYTTLASQVAVALQNARLYVEQAATVTQLRELDRLKSAFLANMSHELRTPLNSILGFTDVMLEGLDGDLTDYMDNDLRLIQKNGRHLLHLINDVLDMAKIESGRMNLHPETFKMHDLLDEVVSITAPLASEKNLSLFIDEDSDNKVEVYADNTRLRQVMINLVNNSIKFTEKGKITLSVKQMSGARVLIAVKDTGIGIPLDHLEAVFQEFTQVDTTTTRKAGGTGLGLPISRRLIEMHGGRLWVESTGIDGEGSTFFVELPVESQIADVIEKQEK